MTGDVDLDNESLTFTFKVKEINAILEILGNAPYMRSAGIIDLIRMQGEPQVVKILKEKEDESKAAPEKSGD